MARRFGVRCEKVLHEAVHFVSRDENVPEELAKEPPRGVAKLRRNRDDRTPHANDSRELPDEVAVTVGLGANGIDGSVHALDSFCDSEFGEIVNMDRLQAIVTRGKDSEDGQVAENPGNVVDQDVLPSEEDGRT